MKKNTKTIVILILTFLPIIYTAVATFFMPATVAVHFGVNGEVDRYGSKYEAFILPAVMVIVCIAYHIIRAVALHSASDDNQKVRANFSVIDTIVVYLFGFFNALNIFLLYAMVHPDIITENDSILAIIIAAIAGLLFVAVGNILPKTRRNSVVGLRMRFSLDTDEHWYIANRASGIAMVAAGLLTIVSGFVLRSFNFLFVMIAVLLVSQIVAILCAYGKIKKK